MTKTRVWLRFLLGEAMVFGLLHSLLAVAVCAFMPNAGLAFPALLLFILTAAMGIARALLPNAALLLASHVALAALPALLPLPAPYKVPLVALPAVAAIISLAKRLAAERTERENRETYGRGTAEEYARIKGSGTAYTFGWPGLITFEAILAGLSIAAGVFGVQGVQGILLGWGIFLLAAFLVLLQTTRLDRELAHLSLHTRQPVRAILNMNNVVLLVLLALLVPAALIAPLLPMDALLSALWAGLLALVRAVAQLLARLFAGGEAEEEPVPEEIPPPAEAPAELEAAGPSLLAEILMVVLQVAVVLALVVFAAWAAYRLYRRFAGARGVGTGDEREFLVPAFEAVTLDNIRRRLRAMMPRFGSGPQARIRRQYYRTVRRHIRRGAKVSASDTTGEIRRTLGEREDLHALTEQYDEARYGPPEQ